MDSRLVARLRDPLSLLYSVVNAFVPSHTDPQQGARLSSSILSGAFFLPEGVALNPQTQIGTTQNNI